MPSLTWPAAQETLGPCRRAARRLQAHGVASSKHPYCPYQQVPGFQMPNRLSSSLGPHVDWTHVDPFRRAQVPETFKIPRAAGITGRSCCPSLNAARVGLTLARPVPPISLWSSPDYHTPLGNSRAPTHTLCATHTPSVVLTTTPASQGSSRVSHLPSIRAHRGQVPQGPRAQASGPSAPHQRCPIAVMPGEGCKVPPHYLRHPVALPREPNLCCVCLTCLCGHSHEAPL